MVIAVDTGGTKTLVAAFSKTGALLSRHRFTTPKDPNAYIETLTKLITTEYDGGKTAKALCVAVPGLVRRNVAVFCPNLGWQNFDIAGALQTKLGATVPVWLENDANLAGLAEAHAVPKMPRACLYITISTGIGTGVIQNGHIDPGFRLSEGGHMMLEYDGLVRSWESFASGRAIYETYGTYARDITAESVWAQIADKISRGLLAIIPLLHPDSIIIGGSIGTYFPRYETTLGKLLKEQLPSYIDQPIISQAKHPEEAVIYGCYQYAYEKLT